MRSTAGNSRFIKSFGAIFPLFSIKFIFYVKLRWQCENIINFVQFSNFCSDKFQDLLTLKAFESSTMAHLYKLLQSSQKNKFAVLEKSTSLFANLNIMTFINLHYKSDHQDWFLKVNIFELVMCRPYQG